MSELGTELRRRRESAGLSLAALAAMAHFTKGYLSKVETGRVRVNASVAEAYDRALGTPGALVAMLGEPPARHPAAHFAGLPAAGRHFLGRAPELSALSAMLTGSDDARVCVVHGLAGAGKTALAIEAACDAESAFADGALFFDLRGYTPGVPALEPAESLRQLLRLLEVDSERVPPDVDGRANLLRDRLRGKQMLLVLDNARSAAQVAPLLPGEPACRVLVTSRGRLPALDDAWHQAVGVLPDNDALALLRAMTGDAMPEPAIASAIVGHCGRLPLAIRIAGARLAAGGWSGRRLRDRLARESTRLAALDDGERSVAAAFAVSCEALSAEQRRVFALLALHPATSIEPGAVRALAGKEVDPVTDRLHDAHLLTLDDEGRAELHDLVRLFALRHLLPELGEDERRAAVVRLVDHTAATLAAADELTEPHRFRLPIDVARPEALPFEDAGTALDWLRRQWPALAGVTELAAEYGVPRRCWQLAFTLRAFFFRDKLFEPWLRTHERALAAAEAEGDEAAAGMILNNLGMAHVERGALDEAFDCHRRAHTRCAVAGDERGATDALASLAWVRIYQGDASTALAELTDALAVYRAAGRGRNVVITLRGIALALTELGRFAEALEAAREARALAEEPMAAVMSVNCLAWIHFRAGDLDAAHERYTEAARLADLAGSGYEQARARVGLGNVAHRRGDPAAAATHWKTADDSGVVLDARVLGEPRARAEVA